MIPLIFIFTTLGFVTIWVTVVWLLSLLGGWSQIAATYPAQTQQAVTCFSGQTAQLRGVGNYRGILIVCADTEVVHFRTPGLFRPGHAPFSVPWEDITVGETQRRRTELQFQQVPNISMYVQPQLVEKLAPSADGRWQTE